MNEGQGKGKVKDVGVASSVKRENGPETREAGRWSIETG
jgi:hypothetical protein